MMNSARAGKNIRLKTNLKRVSNNNRYKPINIMDEDEVKAQSLSRSKPKRSNVPNVNTSLVVNRTHFKKNLVTGVPEFDIKKDTDRRHSKDKNKLLHSIDVKQMVQTSNTHRNAKKQVFSNHDSQPDVQTIHNILNESQSEIKPSKPKQSALRTLENPKGNNLTTKPFTNINKTINPAKSGRSPTETTFTNPQAPKTVTSEKPEFPMGAGKALKLFMGKISDYEKGEILDYRQVFFLGLESKKVKATSLLSPNYGFDNDKGDYKTVMRDHI